MTRKTILLLAAVLLIASTASARNKVGEQFDRRLDDSASALSKGDYARSLQIADNLIEDMILTLGPGNKATEFFGLALMHKALAEAGLGRTEDALWDWHTVLTLYPKFQNQRLEGYGAAGQFLMDNKVLRIPTTPNVPVKADGKFTTTIAPGYKNVVEPRITKRVRARYPQGALYFGSGGTLLAEVIITKEGRVTAPMIVKALPAPTLSYVALQSLRQWRFEPGTVDGQPVPVTFNVAVNFDIKRR